MMKILCILGLWMAFSLSILQAKEIKMSSPDGKYQVTLSDEGGNLHYSVNWNHKEAIKPSLYHPMPIGHAKPHWH